MPTLPKRPVEILTIHPDTGTIVGSGLYTEVAWCIPNMLIEHG